MKIVIIANTTKNLARTRKQLLQSILNKNYEVVAICSKKECLDELEKMGVTVKLVKNNLISVNFINILKYFFNIVKVLKNEKPDIVFSYTIKPCIIGSIAAKIEKVPRIYSMITGMGYIYSSDKFRVKFIRIFCNFGYKLACKFNTRVIFQNKEDKEDFVNKKYLKESQAFVVDGSGVDIEKFKRYKLPEDFNFLMISRILDVKGIKEFCEAAKIIKNKYFNVTFTLIGKTEKSFRGLNLKHIEKYKDIVKYEGYKENVIPYIQKSKVFVLPSYLREGVPRTLLEALAVGRPIITTNLRGCKEAIIEKKNGLLVKPKDVYDLAKKMEYMIKNEDKLEKMAEYSNQYAKERFDIKLINKKMIEIMKL